MNSHLWQGGGVPVGLGITGGVLVGALWGVFNAIFVGIFKLPSFVVTLGTMGMAHGLALMVSETAISVPDGMRSLAEGMWLGLPVPLWLILLTALFCSFLLRHTTIGRAIYAVGGNATAARFSGIDERKPLFFVFALSGALTGLAGMIEVARLSSAQPTTGESYPLDAIAAVVIGGGSLFGGEGAVIGTVIGALVIAVLRNGLDLMSVQPFTQMVIIGALVIVAVALDQWRRRP
jgi:ribose/xylose/arabinose/galactoside ABC-type transport system permease subunit